VAHAHRRDGQAEVGGLNAVCLLVAGVLRASLPATDFTLAWQHSVEKTRWEERYRIDGDRLMLDRARIQGLGAGMEPPADARLVDGWWVWEPGVELSELRITLSAFTRDYDVCWQDRCESLATLARAAPTSNQAVTLRPCVR